MLWDEIRSAKSSAFALKYCTTYTQRGLQPALIGHLWYWLPAACQSRCFQHQDVHALFHARRLTTVTAVSLLVVRSCGTVYQLHFDWTCHCLYFVHGWKHFWWQATTPATVDMAHLLHFSNLRHINDIHSFIHSFIHLANKLKPYCDQAKRQHFHVWNSQRLSACGAAITNNSLYNGSFSATAIAYSSVSCLVSVLVKCRFSVLDNNTTKIQLIYQFMRPPQPSCTDIVIVISLYRQHLGEYFLD